LTGRPPFAGPTVMDTLFQVMEHEPVPPRSLSPAVPADLETICLKCLRKEPGQRYASAEALAQDLDNWLANRSIAARPARWPERAWRWARRNPVVAALLGVVTLAALGLAGAGVWFTRTVQAERNTAQWE